MHTINTPNTYTHITATHVHFPLGVFRPVGQLDRREGAQPGMGDYGAGSWSLTSARAMNTPGNVSENWFIYWGQGKGYLCPGEVTRVSGPRYVWP